MKRILAIHLEVGEEFGNAEFIEVPLDKEQMTKIHNNLYQGIKIKEKIR